MLFLEPESLPAIAAASELMVPSSPAPPSRNPAAVYLASLGAGSRRMMRRALDLVAEVASGGRADAETLPWHGLRYQHTAAIRAALADRFAPATTNKALAALRGVLREAWRLGLLSAEEHARAADLKGVKGVRLPAGRGLSAGEIRALFLACAADPVPEGARDAAPE